VLVGGAAGQAIDDRSGLQPDLIGAFERVRLLDCGAQRAVARPGGAPSVALTGILLMGRVRQVEAPARPGRAVPAAGGLAARTGTQPRGSSRKARSTSKASRRESVRDPSASAIAQVRRPCSNSGPAENSNAESRKRGSETTKSAPVFTSFAATSGGGLGLVAI